MEPGPTTEQIGRRSRSLSLLFLLAVVPLALAACSSSSASGSSTSTSKPSTKASRTAYTACLKQHGVSLPNFAGGPGGANAGGGTRPSFPTGSFPTGGGGFGTGGLQNNPKFQKAATACKSLRPSGGFAGRFGGSGGFNSAGFAAYRNCLTLHGITLGSQGSSGRPTGSSPPTTIDQASPTVKAALAACAPLRPGTSSPTTTTTG